MTWKMSQVKSIREIYSAEINIVINIILIKLVMPMWFTWSTNEYHQSLHRWSKFRFWTIFIRQKNLGSSCILTNCYGTKTIVICQDFEYFHSKPVARKAVHSRHREMIKIGNVESRFSLLSQRWMFKN
jgi:hypothetical protein